MFNTARGTFQETSSGSWKNKSLQPGPCCAALAGGDVAWELFPLLSVAKVPLYPQKSLYPTWKGLRVQLVVVLALMGAMEAGGLRTGVQNYW